LPTCVDLRQAVSRHVTRVYTRACYSLNLAIMRVRYSLIVLAEWFSLEAKAALPMPTFQPARSDPQPVIAGYTDEAQYNVGRYRGLAMLSLRGEDAASCSRDLRAILRASSIHECKWEKVRSAKTLFAARALLDWTIGQVERGILRVDTLTWDTEEGSRAGLGVPHIANLRKMYRILLESVVPERWGARAEWHLYPDEQTAMPWQRLIDGLPQVAGITASRSHEHQLIQLADLLAGLAVYSRDSYDLYERWLDNPRDRHGYPDSGRIAGGTNRYSASDRVRCLLLDDFFTSCKLHQLGVSLRTRRGLFTGDARPGLVFRWWINDRVAPGP
jgi:hypothetical protein